MDPLGTPNNFCLIGVGHFSIGWDLPFGLPHGCWQAVLVFGVFWFCSFLVGGCKRHSLTITIPRAKGCRERERHTHTLTMAPTQPSGLNQTPGRGSNRSQGSRCFRKEAIRWRPKQGHRCARLGFRVPCQCWLKQRKW